MTTFRGTLGSRKADSTTKAVAIHPEISEKFSENFRGSQGVNVKGLNIVNYLAKISI